MLLWWVVVLVVRSSDDVVVVVVVSSHGRTGTRLALVSCIAKPSFPRMLSTNAGLCGSCFARAKLDCTCVDRSVPACVHFMSDR